MPVKRAKKKAVKAAKPKRASKKRKPKAAEAAKQALEGMPFDCLLCGKEFKVPKEQLIEGERVECPVCGTVLVLAKKDDVFILTEEEKVIEAETEYDYE